MTTQTTTPRYCPTCQRDRNPRGFCHNECAMCDAYRRRTGMARPPDITRRPSPTKGKPSARKGRRFGLNAAGCVICGNTKTYAKGLCKTHYEYNRLHGYDKPAPKVKPVKPQPPEGYMRQKDIARHIGVSKQCISAWIHHHNPPYITLTTSRRYYNLEKILAMGQITKEKCQRPYAKATREAPPQRVYGPVGCADDLSRIINTNRRAAELNYCELAELAVVSDVTIRKIEQAQTLPSLTSLLPILAALGLRLVVEPIAKPEETP